MFNAVFSCPDGKGRLLAAAYDKDLRIQDDEHIRTLHTRVWSSSSNRWIGTRDRPKHRRAVGEKFAGLRSRRWCGYPRRHHTDGSKRDRHDGRSIRMGLGEYIAHSALDSTLLERRTSTMLHCTTRAGH